MHPTFIFHSGSLTSCFWCLSFGQEGGFIEIIAGGCPDHEYSQDVTDARGLVNLNSPGCAIQSGESNYGYKLFVLCFALLATTVLCNFVDYFRMPTVSVVGIPVVSHQQTAATSG